MEHQRDRSPPEAPPGTIPRETPAGRINRPEHHREHLRTLHTTTGHRPLDVQSLPPGSYTTRCCSDTSMCFKGYAFRHEWSPTACAHHYGILPSRDISRSLQVIRGALFPIWGHRASDFLKLVPRCPLPAVSPSLPCWPIWPKQEKETPSRKQCAFKGRLFRSASVLLRRFAHLKLF